MSSAPSIKVRKTIETARLPVYSSKGAAGADLSACIEADVTLEPGERKLIPTGLMMEIPPGYEGQVRPRSGLAIKSGVTVLNAPGTIDADYRGEVQVILINSGTIPFTIHNGDRIAQLIIAPVCAASFVEHASLADSARAASGFGSTGI